MAEVTRGIMALKERHDAEQKAKSSGRSKSLKPGFFKLDEGDTITLRFVEEGYDWLGPKQHSFVQTKEEPADYKGNWPNSVNAVCRYDDLIDADECYICDNRVENNYGNFSYPSRKVYTLAQVREPVYGDGTANMGGPDMKGRILFYVPKMMEVDHPETGKKIEIPEFIIINQNLENFANPLEVHLLDYGTILDRDYRVTRMGSGVKTSYSFNPVPTGKDEDFVPGTDEWKTYVEEPLELMSVTLEDDLKYKGSEDFYARWIDPNKEIPSSGNNSSSKGGNSSGGGSNRPSGGGGASSAKKNPTASSDALKAARDKVKALRKNQ